MRIPLSVVYITKNEAGRIGKSLDSVQWCDEIIVLDSNSSDGTEELCRLKGAKVYQQEFLGYGKQKQTALEKANHKWILSLDADEVLSAELQKEIQELLSTEPETKAFYLRRKLVFLGKLFRFGNESRDYQLRLFHRDFARWNENEVHEGVETKEKTGRLKGTLMHYSFDNLDQYFIKFNQYTTLAAADLAKRGKHRSKILNILSAWFYFFQIYFLRGNFLNGYYGFLWSLFSSIYPVVKYEKARTAGSPAGKYVSE